MYTSVLLRQKMVYYFMIMGLFCHFVTTTKQKHGAPSPQAVTAMGAAREQGPIDKRELEKRKAQRTARLEKRHARRGGKGAKQKKIVLRNTLKDMDYEETKAGKDKLIAAGNYHIALKYFDRMLKLCDNIDEIEAITIEFADAHFACGNFQKAATMYTAFAHTYPGSSQAEYALFRAIICSSKLILEPDRDQTKTHETIELASLFLAREMILPEHRQTVEAIRATCFEIVGQSECSICSFYIVMNELGQAQRRIDSLRNDWMDRIPHIEPRLIAFEYDIAMKKNDPVLVAQKEQELLAKFPTITMELAHAGATTNFLTRF